MLNSSIILFAQSGGTLMDSRSVLFFVLVAISLASLVIVPWRDVKRIRRDVESRGGKTIKIRWAPFAMPEHHKARVYKVTYRYNAGEIVVARCETKASIGVQWHHPKTRLKNRV